MHTTSGGAQEKNRAKRNIPSPQFFYLCSTSYWKCSYANIGLSIAVITSQAEERYDIKTFVK